MPPPKLRGGFFLPSYHPRIQDVLHKSPPLPAGRPNKPNSVDDSTAKAALNAVPKASPTLASSASSTASHGTFNPNTSWNSSHAPKRLDKNWFTAHKARGRR